MVRTSIYELTERIKPMTLVLDNEMIANLKKQRFEKCLCFGNCSVTAFKELPLAPCKQASTSLLDDEKTMTLLPP